MDEKPRLLVITHHLQLNNISPEETPLLLHGSHSRRHIAPRHLACSMRTL